ncbi:MAG: hypothetical protein ABI680_15040 [Chthoniobacteraceae bacterium]
MRSLAASLGFCLLAATASARLGDTQEMAEARYGLPKKRTHSAPTILSGAKELTFEFEGWRIHCALLRASDGEEYVVREKYSKIWTSPVVKAGGSSRINDFERNAVLKGEAGSGSWTPKILGNAGKDLTTTFGNQIAHITGLTGKVWIRDDGAIARAQFGGGPILLDLPQARKYEAELKAIKEQKARAAVPKFCG